MAKSKTTWKPGQSGNPKGRPRTGEGIVKGLVDELNKRGQAAKLHRELIKRALDKNADWRLIMAVYDYLFKVYQHEKDTETDALMEEIRDRMEEICQSRRR